MLFLQSALNILGSLARTPIAWQELNESRFVSSNSTKIEASLANQPAIKPKRMSFCAPGCWEEVAQAPPARLDPQDHLGPASDRHRLLAALD